ncbi:MAG: hypothetical protein J1F02_05520 [Lachnospiraceae bacterium]|nr:hypothetical protein [Lachnospiraceae bacterium]
MERRQVRTIKIRRMGCSLCLILGVLMVLAACGNGIKEETRDAVNEKVDQALQLYTDIEKIVQENHLTADKVFTDMKTQLADMSEKIKTGIEETTEEDGQATIQELDMMIQNLQSVKESLERDVAAG